MYRPSWLSCLTHPHIYRLRVRAGSVNPAQLELLLCAPHCSKEDKKYSSPQPADKGWKYRCEIDLAAPSQASQALLSLHITGRCFKCKPDMGYILYLSKEEQRGGEAFNASAFLLFLCSACANFTLIPPNPIWNAANATAGQSWPEGGNNKEKRRIKNHHLSHGISLLQFLDERLTPFTKSPPQSQSSSPRKFKLRSPMYHSCIIGFNFHCSLTEGQINVVHLSCTNQREQRIHIQ